jgi:predicted dehydrogenase
MALTYLTRRRALLALCMAGGLSFHASSAAAQGVPPRFRLITLDPGHFHASLVQKFANPDIDTVVHVFAPLSDDVKQHLLRIDGFNTRADNPTHWVEQVYTGSDYLERMLASKPGNIVVIAGNNARKTEYIVRSIDAGLNVLADKPMVRTPADLVRLRKAFAVAKAKHLLLYDIMTERSEVTTQLQRELSMRPELFGTLVKGTLEHPAVSMESIHYFSKLVAGKPLLRPQWFFDVRQEGDGIVDVTTHLVDLVQWEAFPDQALAMSDVRMLRARRWPTALSRAQFAQVTGATDFPAYLERDVKDGALQVYSNGEMDYRIRGVHAHVSVEWRFETPNGGDAHHSIMRGTKATLTIKQGAEEGYKPVLYIEPATPGDSASQRALVPAAIEALRSRYPGIGVHRAGTAWVVDVPAALDVGHEAHFGQVTDRYLSYLRAGSMPAWEVPNMLVKYGTIMDAYTMSGAR